MANEIAGLLVGEAGNSLTRGLDEAWENSPMGEVKFRRQLERQGRLDEQSAATQFKYGQMSADASQLRQIELINMINKMNSPQEKMKALKEAGLSPSLLAGGVGAPTAGGANVAQGQQPSITGGRADAGEAMANLSMDRRMQVAQIRALEADTRGKEIDNEDKEDTKGTRREIGEATLQNLLQDLNNKKVNETATALDNEERATRNEITKATKEWQIQKVFSDLEEQAARINNIEEDILNSQASREEKRQLLEDARKINAQRINNMVLDAAESQAKIRGLNDENDRAELRTAIIENQKKMQELTINYTESNNNVMNEINNELNYWQKREKDSKLSPIQRMAASINVIGASLTKKMVSGKGGISVGGIGL